MMVRKWLMRWRDHGGGSGGEVAVGGPKGELLASVHGFFSPEDNLPHCQKLLLARVVVR